MLGVVKRMSRGVCRSVRAHGKCAFVAILAVLIAQGCDDGASSPDDPCKACGPDQICNNGVCYNASDPCLACSAEQTCVNSVCYDPDDPCTKCTAQEECIDHECKPRQDDDPCSKCTGEQVCVDKQCKDPESDKKCDPECTDGKTCVDGRCAICIGSNCFFDGDDSEQCQSDDECPEGQECNDGECEEIQGGECDPACVDGQVCDNGTCVNNTLLWTLCRAGSDCGVGECIFSVTPSKTTHLEVNGEIQEFTTEKPIPLSVLDSRISPEYYNKTHSSQAGESDDIGVCAYECTKKEDEVCPSGWSCQVIAKGILDYPDNIQLPQDLPETALKDTPFAAICRRDMNEDLQKDLNYGIELCNADESACSAAGMVFYDGMCLEPCDDNADKCPLFFSCQDAGSAKACVPDSGTCTGCYDHDKDGAGYGHCANPGIDCDDDNPNRYYQKTLACSDIDDKTATDLNCNGLIDKFELLGTSDNCNACGSACNKAQTANITVTCDPVNATDYNADWRKTATIETVAPEFTCVEKCAFGYGDCKGNTTCDVALLSSEARVAEKDNDEIWVRATDVITGKTGGAVYGRDTDSDGYFPIDNVASIHSATDTDPAQILFDQNNTLVCCSGNTKYCYTANKAWKTVQSPQSYVTLKDGCKTTDPGCYDADDSDSEINPEAVEVCDGKDNDGSRILLKPETAACSVWCADTANDCSSIVIKDGDTITGYRGNPWCDATPDGLNEPNKWVDTGDNHEPHKQYSFGEICSVRNENNDVCNDRANVTCEKLADDNYALQCTGKNEATVDGLLDGEILFDGKDDDCDGIIDEDAMIPCVITQNAPYNEIANGVESTSFYKSYKSANNYELPTNIDGSVNLCRIGILQSKAVTEGDSTTYKTICKPLYKPRTYDFYGDAFDSNCDGVDYDIDHTVFVTKDDQGDLLGSDSNLCRFDAEKGFVSPCSTLQGAIEKAANKDADDKVVFYDDIILRQKDFDITASSVESDGKTSYALKIPTLGQQDNKQTLHVYPSADLPDEENHVKEGHIISAYKMHALLTESKRSNSAFDPNQYYFRYESLTIKTEIIGGVETTTYIYNPVNKQSEQSQPEEIIRIYGGFNRINNSIYQMPAEFDLWKQESKPTKITWTPTIPAVNPPQIYALMQPSSQNPFSLKLDSLEINVTPSGVLPASLADGATFIGINAMVGAKILNLSNIKLNVKAIDGYSFATNDFPKAVADNPNESNVIALSNNPIIATTNNNNIFADPHAYDSQYQYNLCHLNGTPTCPTDDLSGLRIPGGGGCPGYSYFKTNSNKIDFHNGKEGLGGTGNGDLSKYGQGGSAGTASGGNFCGSYSYCYQSCTGIWKFPTAQGEGGYGGQPGENGDSDKTTMAFVIDTAHTPYSLYVQSDRSQSKGHYGYTGGGGGGGAVYNCDEDQGMGDKISTACLGPRGGFGGCGGEGGQAGGTGGSAIGIAVRSTSTTEGSTRILMDATTKVTTHNGSGGSPQPGGAGGAGSSTNGWASAIDQCLNSGAYGGAGAGGGGGAGGIGAGGLAGWTYPFVFTCNHDSITKDSCDNSTDTNCFNDTVLASLSNCGFDLPTNFTGDPSINGDQKTEGNRIEHIYSEDENQKKQGKQSVVSLTAVAYNNNACAGVNTYRTPGGAGGQAVAVTQTNAVKDTACLRGTAPIYVRAVREE